MLSREMVMRVTQVITKEEMLCPFIKTPQLISGECMNISLENLYVDNLLRLNGKACPQKFQINTPATST